MIRSIRTLPIYTTIFLVGCSAFITENKEYSCAPQNIKYDLYSDKGVYQDLLKCDSPIVANSVEITCKKGTIVENGLAKSCVSDNARIGGQFDHLQNTKYTIKPIVFTADELFQKKTECNKLIPQIDKLLKEEDAAMNTFSITGKVFYSISMNSCLYDYSQSELSRGLETNELKDAMTNEQLEFAMGQIHDPEYQKELEKFHNALIKYQ